MDIVKKVKSWKHDFEVVIDDSRPFEYINAIRDDALNNGVEFRKYSSSGCDEFATCDEVLNDCDNLEAYVRRLFDDEVLLRQVVENHVKKANGTFKRGSVQILFDTDNTCELREDEWCYVTVCVRAKAVSDNMLHIIVMENKHGW